MCYSFEILIVPARVCPLVKSFTKVDKFATGLNESFESVVIDFR